MHLTAFENPYVERFVGTLRRELLNHVIIFSESHLNSLLTEYIEQYYHCARPHQGLDGDTPESTKSPEVVEGPAANYSHKLTSQGPISPLLDWGTCLDRLNRRDSQLRLADDPG